jgi:hypothetical protein
MKVVLPTLSKICNKYDLFDGYDSKKYYIQYFGGVHLLLEKRDDELVLEIRARIDRTTLSRFVQFVNELSSNLEKIVKEAEEMLSTP